MDDFSPGDLKSILHSKRANIYLLEHCRVLVKGGRVEYITDQGKRSLYWSIPASKAATVMLGIDSRDQGAVQAVFLNNRLRRILRVTHRAVADASDRLHAYEGHHRSSKSRRALLTRRAADAEIAKQPNSPSSWLWPSTKQEALFVPQTPETTKAGFPAPSDLVHLSAC